MQLKPVKVYLVKRYGKVFVHVGIYIDDRQIYHYATISDNILTGKHVTKESTLKEFALNRKVKYSYLQSIEENVLTQRTMSFLMRKQEYNIITNNCITFVLYCLSGRYPTIKEMLSFAIHHKILLFSALSIS